MTTPLQAAWASLPLHRRRANICRPLEGRAAESARASLAEINEDAVDRARPAQGLGRARSRPSRPAPSSNIAAWQMTGDKTWLERLHADAIRTKSQNMYMQTEGHWWSDRVDQPNEILQRERLGGIALRRNQTWPGNTVSWRFDDPEGAEQVAILLPGATPNRFKVVAYNMSDRPQRATMTGWNVTAGRWRMTQRCRRERRRQGRRPRRRADVPLERSASVEVAFAPRQTTVLEFALEQPATPVERRPDLGIGEDDVVLRGAGWR